MIASLWYYLQTDPFYKNNSIVVITTDHGRGNKPTTWHSHSMLRGGSSETWMALLGRDIDAIGEMQEPAQLYQKQIAATIAKLIQQPYTADHPIATAINLPTNRAAGITNNNVIPFQSNGMAPVIDFTTALFFLISLLAFGYSRKVKPNNNFIKEAA
jgi:hypothetical protein